MTVKLVDNPKTPIGGLLRAAKHGGVLLKRKGKNRFLLAPLDDDMLDFLLEHSPKLIKECDARRRNARAGKVKSLEEVEREFGQ